MSSLSSLPAGAPPSLLLRNGSSPLPPQILAVSYPISRARRDLRANCTQLVAESPTEIPPEVEVLLNPYELEILKKNETPNLSKLSTSKWNPIHTCALAGQINIMTNLLERGLHIDAVDKDGYTALHKAVITKKEAIVSLLLRRGANPHVKDMSGAAPLHYAVQVGAIQTVKLLIKNNVDVNVADNDGWTPLHIAMQCRSRDIAKVLLRNGADTTRRSKDGKLALDIAMCYGKNFKSYELTKFLKQVPANRDP